MRLVLAVLLLAAGFGATVGSLTAHPQALASMPTEELIDQFQQESEQTAGANTSMSVESFIGADAPLSFDGGLLGVPLPKVSLVMRELVRRGLAAVPALLDHLTEARPTKLLIKRDRAIGSMQFLNEEYDPKDFDAKELPAGVHRINAKAAWGNMFFEYRLRIGDLCYAALGQIVNRRRSGTGKVAG